jgi:glutaredoxin 2
MKGSRNLGPLFFRDNMKLELYYYDQCPFCQYVLRKIDQLGIKDKIHFKNTLMDREAAEFHV